MAAIASVSASLQSKADLAATAGVPLYIAADQEGGQVQVLSGAGFSSIPRALTQGGYSVASLRADAKVWGGQLKAAGVHVNLAPVLDTVPSAAFARSNPPIGYYEREYGFDPAVVSATGAAFAQGMADAGVDASIKHFPGLGRVRANPDVSSGVTDSRTTRTDSYLQPYLTAVNAGAPMLMMSTAYYSKIDAANPAAFSSTIVTGMVRGDLGFSGVIVSDDLGQAAQVQAWTPGARAIDFLNAGGDLVLTVDPSVMPAMYNAVLQKANAESAFRAKIDASALRILTAKDNRSLIGRGMDVSSVQGNVGWQAVYNNGARFAYVKATEGASYVNPYFAQQYNGSYNVGMTRGAYHNARPDSSAGASQADYFLSHGGGWSGDGRTLPPALVLQPGPSVICYGLSPAAMISWIAAFSTTMHTRTAKYPMIYTSLDWWNACTGDSSAFAATNPFWIPRYGASPPAPIPAGSATWTIWQSASAGLLPGGQDRFNGSSFQLRALATNPD
ncbi:MAG: GH25 family lysozyme [Jatrophihabitantaceae bacterium]